MFIYAQECVWQNLCILRIFMENRKVKFCFSWWYSSVGAGGWLLPGLVQYRSPKEKKGGRMEILKFSFSPGILFFSLMYFYLTLSNCSYLRDAVWRLSTCIHKCSEWSDQGNWYIFCLRHLIVIFCCEHSKYSVCSSEIINCCQPLLSYCVWNVESYSSLSTSAPLSINHPLSILPSPDCSSCYSGLHFFEINFYPSVCF